MYSRIVDCHLRTDRLPDARRTLDSELIPQLRKQPGFVDVIESLDATTGHFVCMSLWKTREEADRYGNTEFPRAAEKLEEFIADEPRVSTMQVETSTIHRIAKGKAA